MPRAARADQRGPVEIDARTSRITQQRASSGRVDDGWTGHRPSPYHHHHRHLSPLQPSPSPIVRAMRLADRLGRLTYAGRASPSKIPGWIESHAIRQRMQSRLAAPTDPRDPGPDPDPDPGVLTTATTCLCQSTPCGPYCRAFLFWISQELVCCRFRPGSPGQQAANVGLICWVR